MSHGYVIVKTNGGEGEYILSREGAPCFTAMLKALGYDVEVEELNEESDVPNETF